MAAKKQLEFFDNPHYGPTLKLSQEIHAQKYRAEGETFYEAMCRIAGALADNEQHRIDIKEILLDMRFLPAGRVQAAVGSPKIITPYNCFVSQTIHDSMTSIMDAATKAATTMRLGGGIGYDFSHLRPSGAHIVSLDSFSSGPVSFMGIFDAVCRVICSAGHRRGAQMGVMRVDHPDIEKFIEVKTDLNELTNFNISVAITDKFMEAVLEDKTFDLVFNGEVYSTVSAKNLWEKIMRTTWDYAEPGVIFIDRVNEMNNLYYTETIECTNPCAEQPLPPNGACLLGSTNLVKYIDVENKLFDYISYIEDLHQVVRMLDNVIDIAVYPLEAQEKEAKSKRRMGIGFTGLANAFELLGYEYGSPDFMKELKILCSIHLEACYSASVQLAKEKGVFPKYKSNYYLNSKFIQKLSKKLQKDIAEYGIRNSHLTSIAPTGTISLTADNISSGIEPVFAHSQKRVYRDAHGLREEVLKDYAFSKYGFKCTTISDISPETHVEVLNLVSQYIDSGVSKTINVDENITWDRFKQVYINAWLGGAKGCTTFRINGKRGGILSKNEQDMLDNENEVCYIDPETGQKFCGE